MADLDPRINVTVDGEDREIFMSFGLLNELTSWLGSPEALPAIFVKAEMRSEMLSRLLAERKKSGKLITPVADIDDVEIELADVQRLLQWATEHVLSFFLQSLTVLKGVLERDEEKMTGLGSMLVSSKD